MKESLIGLTSVVLLVLVLASDPGYAQTNARHYQTYRRGDCLHIRGNNQLLGCYSKTANGRLWFQYGNGVVEDVTTGMQFLNDRNGILMVLTQNGWYPAHAHPQVQALSRELSGAPTPQNGGVNVQVGGPPPQSRGGVNVQVGGEPFTAEEKVKAGIDPSVAAGLNRQQANTSGVWNNPPPRPWYGR